MLKDTKLDLTVKYPLLSYCPSVKIFLKEKFVVSAETFIICMTLLAKGIPGISTGPLTDCQSSWLIFKKNQCQVLAFRAEW